MNIQNTPWPITFSYDPYKRSRWYDNDEEWEAHLATLPPKVEKKVEKIVVEKPIVKNVWNIPTNISSKKKILEEDDFPTLDKKPDKNTKEVIEPFSKKYNNEKNYNNTRNSAFDTIKNTTSTNSKRKSKMCRNILNGKKCTYRVCHFAHYTDELEPTICAFKNTCRYQHSTCFFIHPKETMDCFVERLGMQQFRRR